MSYIKMSKTHYCCMLKKMKEILMDSENCTPFKQSPYWNELYHKQTYFLKATQDVQYQINDFFLSNLPCPGHKNAEDGKTWPICRDSNTTKITLITFLHWWCPEHAYFDSKKSFKRYWTSWDAFKNKYVHSKQ